MNRFPFSIGLKLYSTNTSLIKLVHKLKEINQFEYIELFIVPGSMHTHLPMWKELETNFVIHAPHSLQGVNLANKAQWESNQMIFQEVFDFTNELESDLIIVHGGVDGPINETLRQISMLDDKRIILENKPKLGMNGEACVGWSPEEFNNGISTRVLNGMVLDFVHAACAAYANKVSFRSLVKQFLKFNPQIFHLADADTVTSIDNHLNIGKGSMDFEYIMSCIPENAMLTIETPRRDSTNLDEFLDDVEKLKKIYHNLQN